MEADSCQMVFQRELPILQSVKTSRVWWLLTLHSNNNVFTVHTLVQKTRTSSAHCRKKIAIHIEVIHHSPSWNTVRTTKHKNYSSSNTTQPTVKVIAWPKERSYPFAVYPSFPLILVFDIAKLWQLSGMPEAPSSTSTKSASPTTSSSSKSATPTARPDSSSEKNPGREKSFLSLGLKLA